MISEKAEENANRERASIRDYSTKQGEQGRKRRRRLIPKLKDMARVKGKKMKKNESRAKRKKAQAMCISMEEIASSNQASVSNCSSISANICEWRKWVLLHDEPHAVATHIWDFGKARGVKFDGNEREVTEELLEAEIRDRSNVAKEGSIVDETQMGNAKG
ncbi:hypothetical protein A2U01_0000208 [Trifolium medium]|uniref:Uncharacterized protein n=1 Tax=Trifolium medium TaxID=97028 RepID=A0A392LWY2_9FABA|nr:hypothetical protein [Trifolium medium]